jgi:hypothetical protein
MEPANRDDQKEWVKAEDYRSLEADLLDALIDVLIQGAHVEGAHVEGDVIDHGCLSTVEDLCARFADSGRLERLGGRRYRIKRGGA